jgi:ergothioneine biosynthesis protein EgtB
MPHQVEESVAAGSLAERYREVRALTESLCAPLAVEDYVASSMPEASPAKWHLAHTSWFFETFILAPNVRDYHPFDRQFGYLFNSYYNTVGDRLARLRRGLLTRPTVEEVYRYRVIVDEHMLSLLSASELEQMSALRPVVELGLHHEQQHQELLLTDVKHLFSCNPLLPTYRELPASCAGGVQPIHWSSYPPGMHWIGHDGNGFAFDNEGPRHQVYLQGFHLASRLVTSGEYQEFVNDGGYHRPEWWLSDGWDVCRKYGWQAPLYWERDAGQWRVFTLGGLRELDGAEPVCHVSYYEADAYARWTGARLPREIEWEAASASRPVQGRFLDVNRLHPTPLAKPVDYDADPHQLFGDVWEWTASPYVPYPGYQPAAGALGEYNGKFMCNQMVLRGGSCATPPGHVRRSYRNFFPPEARWQFTGIRLARDS